MPAACRFRAATVLDIVRNYGPLLLVGDYPRGPLGGLAMTLILSVACLAATFPAAVLVALARTSGCPALVKACVAFVYVVRGMPLLMLVFWFYYFLPLVTGFTISPFATMLIALTVYQTGYLSEVIRAAIEALPVGQRDAAAALGMKYLPATFLVILPQALANSIPGILNQFILIVKETSLGYMITFNELTYSANQLNNILLVRPVEIFMLLAATYLVICSGLSRISSLLERRLAAPSRAAEPA